MKKIRFNNGNETEIGKIVCVGRNYAEHAKELGNDIPEAPILFLKPASAFIFSGDNIIFPSFGNELHHEAELVLLIGSFLKDADIQEAESAVAGYAIGLDMTLRDVQDALKKKGHPWTVSKCFDTSGVLSDFVSSGEYKLKGKEKITLSVNGNIRQNSTLDKMIFSAAELISNISSVMKLEPGDLIFTGTPSGVGSVKRGDIITAEIENIASIETKII